MRAERLLSLLMLLQRGECLPAPALARELGVSVRTIYRDVDALAAAGIPVYAELGANGGYRLVENYRTSLTGLTADEIGALLLLKIPEPLAGLDAGQTLKTALLKLFAALWSNPAAEGRAPHIYLDWAGWGQRPAPVPLLQTLYRAVQENRAAVVRYRLINGIEIERSVRPYGLVAKAGDWYLVYTGGGRLHIRPVADFLDAQIGAESFERPADFDLQACWDAHRAALETNRYGFEAALRVSLDALPWLPRLFGSRPYQAGAPDADGWTRVDGAFESLEAARTLVLGLGGAAEVLTPEALRLSVRDFAGQIMRRYAGAG